MDDVASGPAQEIEATVYFHTYDAGALASFTIGRIDPDLWYLDVTREDARHRTFVVDMHHAFSLMEICILAWSRPRPAPRSRKQDWSPRAI